MSTNPLGRIRLVHSLTLVPVLVVTLLTLGLWVAPSSTAALPATSSVATGKIAIVFGWAFIIAVVFT